MVADASPAEPAPDGPLLTNNWFEFVRPVWDDLILRLNPRRVLEIGSYEGASTIYLIDRLARTGPLEIHCVDSWEGGVEHVGQMDMRLIEARFIHNTGRAIGAAPNGVDLRIHKGYSDVCLARLLAQGGANYFDFVYIDGSHQAPDVLCDAVLGFKLLRPGGIIAFDDYLWSEDVTQDRDPLRCPKPAIDAFVNLYFRKLNVLSAPLYQLYAQKIAP